VNEPDWDDLRAFLALARQGSAREAGAQLRASHSTVARRLDALEAALGTRLFDRGPDGFVITEAGRQVLPHAERVEQEMADLQRGVAGRDERLAGPVAVTCGDSGVAALLLRALAGLCERHPEIELRFTVDGRPFDLARREADVAVRALGTGTQPPDFLLGTRVAPVILGTYVAAEHAERLDPERGQARWLGFEDRDLQARLVGGSSYPRLPSWGRFGTLEAYRQAAYVGLGLAMLPVYVGDADPKLRRIARPDLRAVADLWLLCHPDLRDTARVRAVRNAVAAAFREEAPLFRGEWPVSATPRREDGSKTDQGGDVR
jgi:DNA-binding transcriptional LysR family regulator